MGIKYTLKDENELAMKRKGYEWQARFSHIKNGKNWYPYCAGNAPYTIKEARQIAYSKNGQCLSEKYVNSSSLLL
ncbi:948_t:CDS:2 [Funneliformis geosporum]|nr:948_t:CDS:2 [Funneliformis geosporum]